MGRPDVMAIVLILASHLPFLMLHCCNLWRWKPHYQFFPLFLLAIGWLLWRRWPRSRHVCSHSWLETPLLLLGLTTLAASVLLFSPWLAAVAAVLATGGVLCRVVGRDNWRVWFPVWALLWLVVPPPLNWGEHLIHRVQSVTSRASSLMLDVVGVRHLMEGNVLLLPGHRLLVEEACGGVNSVLVLFAAAALFVVAARRPVIWSGLLLGSSIGWAGLTDVGRVVTIGFVRSRYAVDLTSGWQHEVLRFGMLGLALLLLICTDRLLTFLLGPIEFPDHESESPFVKAWNRFVGGSNSQDTDVADQDLSAETVGHGPAVQVDRSRPCRLMVVGFVVLAVLQLLCLAPRGARAERLHQPGLLSSADLFSRSDLPTTIGNWTQVEHATKQRDEVGSMAEFRRIWLYRSDFCDCMVSVDYPFPQWHDLSVCYRGKGWKVVERTDYPSGSECTDKCDPYTEVKMTRPIGKHGLLLFSHGSRSLSQRVASKLIGNPLWSWLPHTDQGAGQEPPPQTEPPTFQLQALVMSETPLSTAHREAIHRLFLEVRQEVLSACAVKQRKLSNE